MCREQAAEFRPHLDALRDQGINLIFIGMGIPSMANDFRTEMKLSSPVWVDTRRLTYKALKFSRGVGTVLNAKTLLNAWRAFRTGHRQRRTQGDWQLNGGVVVARQGGECLYAFASEVAGDHPPIEEVLELARKAKA